MSHIPILGSVLRFAESIRKRAHHLSLGNLRNQLIALLILTSTFVLLGVIVSCSRGIVTDMSNHPDHSKTQGLWWVLVHITDSGHLGEHTEFWDQLIAFTITMGGWILLGGLFLSLLINGFNKHNWRIREGKVRYHFFGKHGVILGWDQSGPATLRFLQDHQCKEIAIFSLTPPETIRDQIRASGKEGKRILKHVYIMHGEFDSKSELKSLSPHLARRIVILGDEMRGRDSRNIKTAMQIATIARQNGSYVPSQPPICHVNIANACAYDLLQEIDIAPDDRKYIEFRSYNYCEQWARRLWGTLGVAETDLAKLHYRPLAHNGPITASDKRHVAVALVGFGQMGQAVAAQVARLGHYANTDLANPKTHTQIIAIDPDVTTRRDEFQSHYHLVRDKDQQGKTVYSLPGVRFDFIEATSLSTLARKKLAQLGQAHQAGEIVLSVVVCASDPDESMSAAIALPSDILLPDIPILVWQETASGLDELAQRLKLQENETSQTPDGQQSFDTRWEDIRFFGRLQDCIIDDGPIEQLAKLIHGIYLGGLKPESPNPKPSQRTWESLGECYRWSNRYQADSFRERLVANGYDLVPMDELAEHEPVEAFPAEVAEQMAVQEHNRWWVERTLAGWALDLNRNDLHLKHPDLKPFSQLDEDTKDYDRKAISGMIEHLRDIGLAVVRVGE